MKRLALFGIVSCAFFVVSCGGFGLFGGGTNESTDSGTNGDQDSGKDEDQNDVINEDADGGTTQDTNDGINEESDGGTNEELDNGVDQDQDNGTDGQARWTFLVFMNGDNNLEEYVPHDFNELEQVGSGDGVHVVVQADRIKGYTTEDGNWTNTRRYYITKDNNLNKVSSTLLEELGELDMGDPNVLSDFLMWANDKYPAQHMALILWDHGDSWRSQSQPELRTVSDDETSGSTLSIAKGDLSKALESIVAARGPLDVIGFDACSMASWEVAHSLKGYALNMVGSEAAMGGEGYLYFEALTLLRDVEVNADGAALADRMARTTVEKAREKTHSAIDLNELDDLTTAIDKLAEVVLNDNSLKQDLLNARAQARGVNNQYKNWYLDLKDLGAVLSRSQNAQLKASGQAILDGINTVVIGAYGKNQFSWVGGLTIMFDTEYDSGSYLNRYAKGTWAKATQWDDLLTWLASN